MHDHSDSPLVSLVEAARQMGIHRSTAYKAYRRKSETSPTGTAFPIPVHRIGTLLKVNRRHLEEFLTTGGYHPDA